MSTVQQNQSVPGGGGGNVLSPPPPPPQSLPSSTTTKTQKKSPWQHLIAGGCAGLVESSICHPLDTIKTRMQLRRQQSTSVTKVVTTIRHSLMDPVIEQIKAKGTSTTSIHEAQPLLRGVTATSGGLHEPGLRMSATVEAAAAAVASVSKVRIQPTSSGMVVTAPLGPIGTAQRIIQREGFLALYKGLTAVYTGIVPKMAIRFVSFEQYLEWGQKYGNNGQPKTSITFTAGLLSGLTEAILVVTPAEVCKIRMQSQYHSMMDPNQMQHRKYTNVLQTAFTITREEGIGALYKGVVPTMLRQGCNQAVNFTVYNMMKTNLMKYQDTTELASWQSLLIGGFSGGMGPLANNPLDVVKTRLQKQVVVPGKIPKYTGLIQACTMIAREEGVLALWKGITPRLLRIMPGQAITFMTFEFVSQQMNRFGFFKKPTTIISQ